MSNKNRKRNLRKITVNDELYLWNVSSYNCDGDGGCSFKIWKNHVTIYNGVVCGEIVTPKYVSEKIKELI